jgi:transposase-like protein
MTDFAKPKSVSATAREMGIPRTTLRWRMAAQVREAEQKRLETSIKETQAKLKEVQESFYSLSKEVSRLSVAMTYKVSQSDLSIAIVDLNRTIDYVHRQNPYGHRR